MKFYFIFTFSDPLDKSIGCFRVECINDDDCDSTRTCLADSYKCSNPCDNVNCGRGSCHVENHQALCTCSPGYMIIDNICQDIDECSNNPCHKSAYCQNAPGNYVCSCPDGLVGDPISSGCRSPGECFTDSDCPSNAACDNARCTNPCENPNICGRNALCSVRAHSAVCKCPGNAKGDPQHECVIVECSDNTDCDLSKSCIDSKCIDPCSLSNSCGQNANCYVENHIGVCTCHPGTTGEFRLEFYSQNYLSMSNT